MTIVQFALRDSKLVLLLEVSVSRLIDELSVSSSLNALDLLLNVLDLPLSKGLMLKENQSANLNASANAHAL
jgi:hypothetical protein